MSRRRRHYSRVRAQSLVAHVHLDGKLVGGGAVENISAGGMLVRTAQQLPCGAPVQLDLVRPGMKRPFRLPGWVVEAAGTPPVLRIRFDPAAESAATRLHALLNELGLRELTEPASPQALTPPLPPLARPRPASAAPAPPTPPTLGPAAAAHAASTPGPMAAAHAAPPPGPVHGPAAPPEWARTQQLQLLALQQQLEQARAQLERHERELELLRTELRSRRAAQA